MKVEYVLVTAFVGAIYLLVKQFAPDLPVTDTVFQTVILYLLAKLGVEVVGKPADALRARFSKNKAKG